MLRHSFLFAALLLGILSHGDVAICGEPDLPNMVDHAPAMESSPLAAGACLPLGMLYMWRRHAALTHQIRVQRSHRNHSSGHEIPTRWLSLRTMRSFLSVLCMVSCVASSLHCVRSYSWRDELRIVTPRTLTSVVAWKGGLSYSVVDISIHEPAFVALETQAADRWMAFNRLPFDWAFQFAWQWEWMRLHAAEIPSWSTAMIAGAMAFALKPKPRTRFSLFDFLALMTFAALLAGMVAALARLRA